MIAVELRKLVLRPRIWTNVLLLCALPIIVGVFLKTADFAPPPGQGGAFLSAVRGNGLLFPAAALALVLPVFLPLSVAVVAGDSIAGEAVGGTLRYLLIRPVGRTRLLFAKIVALVAFVLLAIACVVVSSLIVGVILFGTGTSVTGGAAAGAATSLSGVSLTHGQLTARLLYSIGYIVVAMIGFGAIGLFLSTLTSSSLGAALGALSILITSAVLQTLDAASAVRPYLPTNYWLSWIDFFRDPIFWDSIDKGLLLQAGYVVVFFGAAWANLATKDVTS
ncbi:ABC transporter permease [Kutzneria kofuensis]|uniref:ABC-2 type transport system permease protein n=1 Tax=Kutzneria kofuensis TaxID=103725 RepID=A0A7W9NJL8_9PSEU|nr:ABC transporter permease [Kutzneria kofuensis]MBB5895762.1 ABC-2 type transport system permease protein [Kutzneria kofuensis]